MTDTQSRKIPLRVTNKHALVWNVDDIAALRSTHRICGSLTGTLPHVSQQNVFMGVPLLLMPEEVVLLVQNGVALLVDETQAYQEVKIGHLKRWATKEKESADRQLAVSGKGPSSAQAMSEDALRKRQEREARKLAQALAVPADPLANDSGVPVAPLPSFTAPSNATQNKYSLPSHISSAASHTVVIPAESSQLDWYDPSVASYPTIESAREAGTWDYPSNLEERARCGVFRSLWEQGYYLGGGIKFGGDYLVYPGDPLRFHSHFVATVIQSPTALLRPMEIVAHGRLGTATKKAHLLCEWDDEKREVSYLSVEWAGFG